MTGTSDSAGHLAAMDLQMRRQAERAKEIQRALEAVQSTASNPDATVEATVDSSGILTALTIKPEALDAGAEQLADTIQNVCRDARDALNTRLRQATGPIVEDPAAVTE